MHSVGVHCEVYCVIPFIIFIQSNFITETWIPNTPAYGWSIIHQAIILDWKEKKCHLKVAAMPG